MFENFQKIKEKYEDDFLKRRGVLAVGLSHKITGGKNTGKPCISVWVTRKQSDCFLLKEERIPKKIGPLGRRVLTDVVEGGIPVIQNRKKWQRPIKGGMSIGHPLSTAGTAGCLMYKNNKKYLVSNNHVAIKDYWGGKKGDPVFSPGRWDIPNLEWTKNKDRYIIGKVADFVPIKMTGENRLDVCFVETDKMLSEILEIGEVSGVTKAKIGDEVKLSGRTSGLSHGKIKGTNFSVKVRFRQKDGTRILTIWKDQIISTPMSQGGDSISADTRLYWKINNKLYFGTIEKLHNYYQNNKGKKIEVLSLCRKGINNHNTLYPSISSAKIDWTTIKNSFYHGIKDVYEITSRDGKRIEITEDHSLFNAPKNSHSASLQPKTLDNLENVISITKELKGQKRYKNLDLITLAGLFIADGSWVKKKKEIKYKDNKRSISQRKYKEGQIIKRIAGISISTGGNKRITQFIQRFGNFIHKSKGDYRIYDISLVKKLKDIGLNTSHNCYTKRVPEWLFTASQDEVSAFLKGYFSGDGCIVKGKRPICLQLASVNRKLLEDNQILLSRLKIKSNLDAGGFNHTFSNKRQYKIRIEHRKSVQRFKEKVGFINKDISEVNLSKMKDKAERDLSVRRIRSIEYIGKKPVYDLQINETESFVANGILCHNSGSILINKNNQAIGLLFAGGSQISVFNPIQSILDLGYSFEPPEENKPEYLIVHHTATRRDGTSFEAVRRFHIRERGMSDIAYHYFITANGKLWEGRPRDKVGQHARGMNYKSLGICLTGNFEKETPSEKQLETLIDLLDYLRVEYNIPLKNVLGHREVVATLCPGKNLFSWVKEYRKGTKNHSNQSLILIEEIRQKLNKLEKEIKRSEQ